MTGTMTLLPSRPAADTDAHADLTSNYSLEGIVQGIAEDLVALRAGTISIKDAQARALLAKQYMNGVRLVLNARNSLEQHARTVTAAIEGAA